MPQLAIKKELKQLKLSHPSYLIALGFGSGLSPIMPGTIGTLAAIPLYYLLSFCPLSLYLLLVLFGSLLGIYVCQKTTQALGIDDHSGIVWDEFIGFFITMIAIPNSWHWILLGFVLFRLLDIWKPMPIRWLDTHIKGGLGIMLDDILAGTMACLILHLLILFR